MKAITLSPLENAREDGSDCASEWIERSQVPPETLSAWRTRCRTKIIRDFESGIGCALCPRGTDLTEFLALLAEWDRGFDDAASAEPDAQIMPPAHARPGTIETIFEGANAVAALLTVVDHLPQPDQRSALMICAGIARGVSSDLDQLVGGVR